VRILHSSSFQDDPTRMLRAIRYAGRLDFRIERSTARCLRRDLGHLDAISGARVRHELERFAVEERVGEIVTRASRQGVLAAVCPALGNDSSGRKAVRGLPSLAVSHRDSVLMCLLLAGARPKDISNAVERMALTGRQAAAVAGYVALQSVIGELSRPGLRPSRAVELLGPQPVESVEALALASSGRVASQARRFLDEWRSIRPILHGRDLERLGIASGPKVGSVLRALLVARLDAEVHTRADEVAFVERVATDRRGKTT
jgi:tRNA nucleotidyltransferase (CCA-adding enzyme)